MRLVGAGVGRQEGKPEVIAEKAVGDWFDENLVRSPDKVHFRIFAQCHLPAFDVLMVERVNKAIFFPGYKPELWVQRV